MEKLQVTTEDELTQVANRVLELLHGHRSEHASVVALNGELGAGKTAFVKALARVLGVAEEVTSPTFVIMKQYLCDAAAGSSAYSTLVHIDAYRIEDLDEMRVIHFDEVLAQKETLVCIEWADNIADLLPSSTLRMDLALEIDGTRTIAIA